MLIVIKINHEEKENAKEHQKIYSSGESSDSPGGLGFEKTRRIDK